MEIQSSLTSPIWLGDDYAEEVAAAAAFEADDFLLVEEVFNVDEASLVEVEAFFVDEEECFDVVGATGPPDWLPLIFGGGQVSFAGRATAGTTKGLLIVETLRGAPKYSSSTWRVLT